jgi:phage portal protein BeeE
MSFWTRAISAFTNRPVVDNSPVGMPTGGVQSYISSYSDTGRYISPEEARAAPTVNACVNLISQSIARMEWRILSNNLGIDQAVRGHPLYALLNRAPASYMGAMTWRQSMLIDCLR